MSAMRQWLQQISTILRRDWDPIGCDVPDDEYESYVGPIAALLRDGATDAQFSAYLEWAESENMGLGGPFSQERAAKVIAALQGLGPPPSK
jgi:hypothetical protein